MRDMMQDLMAMFMLMMVQHFFNKTNSNFYETLDTFQVRSQKAVAGDDITSPFLPLMSPLSLSIFWREFRKETQSVEFAKDSFCCCWSLVHRRDSILVLLWETFPRDKVTLIFPFILHPISSSLLLFMGGERNFDGGHLGAKVFSSILGSEKKRSTICSCVDLLSHDEKKSQWWLSLESLSSQLMKQLLPFDISSLLLIHPAPPPPLFSRFYVSCSLFFLIFWSSSTRMTLPVFSLCLCLQYSGFLSNFYLWFFHSVLLFLFDHPLMILLNVRHFLISFIITK